MERNVYRFHLLQNKRGSIDDNPTDGEFPETIANYNREQPACYNELPDAVHDFMRASLGPSPIILPTNKRAFNRPHQLFRVLDSESGELNRGYFRDRFAAENSSV